MKNMKNSNLKLAHLFLMAAILLVAQGCKGQYFVWNMSDVLKLGIIGLLLITVGLFLIYALIADKIDRWKRRVKKNRQEEDAA